MSQIMDPYFNVKAEGIYSSTDAKYRSVGMERHMIFFISVPLHVCFPHSCVFKWKQLWALPGFPGTFDKPKERISREAKARNAEMKRKTIIFFQWQ
jgi:hypothetical protein